MMNLAEVVEVVDTIEVVNTVDKVRTLSAALEGREEQDNCIVRTVASTPSVNRRRDFLLDHQAILLSLCYHSSHFSFLEIV